MANASREEVRRLLQGPIATVPTAFDDRFCLDLGRMTDLTEWWVEQGLVAGTTVIKVAAAIGEGPDLDDEEWPALLGTVVAAARGRAAIVCGLKSKNTLHTIDDAKRARDLGAIAVQIDLPFLHHPVQDDYVRYFTDISDAASIGIMIYNTWWFGCPSITVETMARLADAEYVAALKWTVPPSGGPDYDDMRQFADQVNVIDNSLQWVRCMRNGGRGYISATSHLYPPHELETWALLQAGRYDEAQARYDKIEIPLRAFMAKAAKRSGGYRVAKGAMEIMGRPVGPPRPPTLPLDDDEMDELRTMLIGFGWPVPVAAA
jgi:4-hydroxy-tetrahydrodipicolinate synthase